MPVLRLHLFKYRSEYLTSKLKANLSSRHVNMIAIGGSIGTGIFLTIGYPIHLGGPLLSLLLYFFMSIIVYFIMTMIGELSVYNPSAGAICDYANFYVSPSFGFASGYNYWFNWTVTVVVEVVAAAILVHFWLPHISTTILFVIFFGIICIFNLLSVALYGEIEYWFSLIKVITICIFLVLGMILIVQSPSFGFYHWHFSSKHYSFSTIINLFLFIGFSFQGCELLGIASEEVDNPDTTLPKAIKLIFIRLTAFYLLSLFVVSLLIDSNSKLLILKENIQFSPYTIVFMKYIGSYAANLMNLVIVISLLSAANASLYSATRVLWYLAKIGYAPQILHKIDNERGNPVYSLLASAIVGVFIFLLSISNGNIFHDLVQISSLCGFIAWFGIVYSHYCFRNNFIKYHGGVKSLSYKAIMFPYIQIVSMVVITIILIFQFVSMKNYSIYGFFVTYGALIIFAILYLAHKYILYKKRHNNR